ncbi:hypothetical protein JCM11641_003631 [Rhodosporidiobolus odoratus]
MSFINRDPATLPQGLYNVGYSQANRYTNPHQHGNLPVVLPYGEPDCLRPFVLFSFGTSLSSDPVWVKEDSVLLGYLDPGTVESCHSVRQQIVSHACRVHTAVRYDGYLQRWQALSQERREELILSRFEAEALDAVQGGYPYGRQNAPELALAALLRDQGQGFAALAESLCYVDGRPDQDPRQLHFPIRPHARWERLAGVQEGLVQSRQRREYIDFLLLNRHLALHRLVDRISAELALPGDVTPWPPALAPSDKPRCALCTKKLSKPMCCSRCKTIGRQVNCDRDHQVLHYKHGGHKTICGKPTAELPFASSIPTQTIAPSPNLLYIRRQIQNRPLAYWWVPDVFGEARTLQIHTALFSPMERSAAALEFKRLAFRACDERDDLSVGMIGLLVQGATDVPGVDMEKQLVCVAETFKLSDGADGVTALEIKMDMARAQLDDFPFIKRFLAWEEEQNSIARGLSPAAARADVASTAKTKAQEDALAYELVKQRRAAQAEARALENDVD